jgi:hypothetical protein
MSAATDDLCNKNWRSAGNGRTWHEAAAAAAERQCVLAPLMFRSRDFLGDCSMCCKVMWVARPGIGCAIYETRPAKCRVFRCGWGPRHGTALEADEVQNGSRPQTRSPKRRPGANRPTRSQLSQRVAPIVVLRRAQGTVRADQNPNHRERSMQCYDVSRSGRLF